MFLFYVCHCFFFNFIIPMSENRKISSCFTDICLIDVIVKRSITNLHLVETISCFATCRSKTVTVW